MKKHLDRLMRWLGYVPEAVANDYLGAMTTWKDLYYDEREQGKSLRYRLGASEAKLQELQRSKVTMDEYQALKQALNQRWSRQDAIQKMADYRQKHVPQAAR